MRDLLLDQWRSWPLLVKAAAVVLTLAVLSAGVLYARDGRDYDACDRLVAMQNAGTSSGAEYADALIRCYDLDPETPPAWVDDLSRPAR